MLKEIQFIEKDFIFFFKEMRTVYSREGCNCSCRANQFISKKRKRVDINRFDTDLK